MTADPRRHFRPGGRPWRFDPRERGFSHKRYFGAADPRILPKEGLRRPRRIVEDQQYTFRCGAYAAAVGNGYIRDSRFHPDWQATRITKRQGKSIDEHGSDPRAAMNSLRDDGSVHWTASYKHLDVYGAAGTRDFPPELENEGRENRITGYLGVDDRWDYFDDIRWALYRAYDPHTRTGPVVHAFGRWFNEWNNPPGGIVPRSYDDFSGWHAYLFVDWCIINGVEYLVAQNSYGENVADRGYYYFPRDVVNAEFAAWGNALKIPTGALTKQQIELAKEETIAGYIQRMILQAWYLLSEKFGAYV